MQAKKEQAALDKEQRTQKKKDIENDQGVLSAMWASVLIPNAINDSRIAVKMAPGFKTDKFKNNKNNQLLDELIGQGPKSIAGVTIGKKPFQARDGNWYKLEGKKFKGGTPTGTSPGGTRIF